MVYFVVEPEVAGSLGEDTVMDRSVHPPVVEQLHYRFDGWLGDVVVESFPVFVVMEEAEKALLSADATGARFAGLRVTTSDQFREIYPGRTLPPFRWLKPVGETGRDDVATTGDGRLVVSGRVLEVLRRLGIAHALVEPFEQ